jgi:hypothetical protein
MVAANGDARRPALKIEDKESGDWGAMEEMRRRRW